MKLNTDGLFPLMTTSPRMDTRNSATSRLEVGSNSSSRMDDKDESCTSPNEVEGQDESTTGMEGEDIAGLNSSKTRMEPEDTLGPSIRQKPPSLPICNQQTKLHKKSFIDDLTLLEKISLSNLVEKNKIIGPFNFHDRFNLTMPHQYSILQHQIEDLQIFTKEHHMKLNSSKTKCIPFINSLTKDFEPQLIIDNSSYLEVIYKLKLVGLVITSDLSWNAHVEYTVLTIYCGRSPGSNS